MVTVGSWLPWLRLPWLLTDCRLYSITTPPVITTISTTTATVPSIVYIIRALFPSETLAVLPLSASGAVGEGVCSLEEDIQ